MNAVLSYLKNLWAQQPVKVAGYSAVTALFALLVTKGYLDNDVSDYILSVVALIIGVPATIQVHKAALANVVPPAPSGKRPFGK